MYVSDNQGHIICLGSPVAIPLICTSPVDFGDLAFGSSATLQVTCTAQIPITSLLGLSTSDKTWVATNGSLPTGSLAVGNAFTFPVTWDLVGSQNQNNPGASFGAVSPGIKTGVITIFTKNGVGGYTTSYPISLTGNEVSQDPFLLVTPNEVDFAGLVLGTPQADNGVPGSFIITNAGSSTMTITGYAFAASLDASVTYTNSTNGVNGTILGPNFTSKNIPAVGSTVQPGQSLSVSIIFYATATGAYSSIFQIWSTGGTQYVLLSGSASTSQLLPWVLKPMREVSIPIRSWTLAMSQQAQWLLGASKSVTRVVPPCPSPSQSLRSL